MQKILAGIMTLVLLIPLPLNDILIHTITANTTIDDDEIGNDESGQKDLEAENKTEGETEQEQESEAKEKSVDNKGSISSENQVNKQAETSRKKANDTSKNKESVQGKKADTSHNVVPMENSGDYKYTKNDDGTATITNYFGSYYDVDIVIPDTLDGLTVTGIGKLTFYDRGLSSVVFPKTLTTIGESAFAHNSLTNIDLPESVTTIGEEAFFRNRLSSLDIGKNRLTSIADKAFADNELTHVNIPNDVTSIGKSAFENNQLTHVDIPNSVIDIGLQSFATNNLTTVDIGNNVASIGDYAFNDNQLTKIFIPDSVTTIGQRSFENNQLTSVKVENDGTSFGNEVFVGNGKDPFNLTIIAPDPSTAKVYAYNNFHTFKNINELPEKLFQWHDNGNGTATITGYNGSSKDIVIPDTLAGLSVTGIGDRALWFNQLTSVTLPNSLTSIGSSAFYNNQLTSVMLPKGLISIGNDAFHDNNLTSVTIPGSVINIGNVAFYNNQISSLMVEDGVKHIGESAFNGNQITELMIPDSTTSIGANAFLNNKLSIVTLSNNIKSIESGAFSGNQLTEVIIPDSVTNIGESAFSNNKLSNVTISNNIISIGNSAFSWNQLTEVIIPGSITNIGESAFSYNRLSSILIPKSVTKIGGSAFSWNNQLIKVVIHNPSVTIGTDAFYNSKTWKLSIFGHVPSTAEDYAKAKGNTFKDITTTPEMIYRWSDNGDGTATITGYTGKMDGIVIPDQIEGLTITGIADNAFKDKDLTKVTIPKGVTTIGAQAFAGNAGHFKIIGYDPSAAKTYAEANGHTFIDFYTIPENIFEWTDNGDGTAEITGYSGIGNEVVIPRKLADLTVTSIGEKAFSLKYLNKVVIPNGVTSIGDYAFTYNNLTNLVIPNSVTSIGKGAFQQNQLTSVTIPASVVSIGELAFSFNKLIMVTILNDKTNLGNSLFAFQSNNDEIIKIIGHDPSTAKDYAERVVGFIFKNILIDQTISFEVPTINAIRDITLSDEKTKYTTDMTALKIEDWRFEDNDWRLNVSASQLKKVGGDYELPAGTIKLKPLSEIVQREGTGNLPEKLMNETTAIDDGIITIAEGNDSQGEFDLMFPDSALELSIDPTTVIIAGSEGTTYETTITWDLMTAP